MPTRRPPPTPSARRPRIAALRHLGAGAVAIALALPSGAFAQGAAGDQYNDPFAGEDSGDSTYQGGGGYSGGGGGYSGGGGSGLQESPDTSGAPVLEAAQGPDEAAEAADGSDGLAEAAGSSGRPGELPRTGVEAWFLFVLGGALVAGGAGLRAVGIRLGRSV